MELADYNITLVHIKGSNNILEDVISRLKMLEIYKDPIEDPKLLKASNTQQHIAEVNTSEIHTFSSNVLSAEQEWDITCQKLASQSHCCKKYLQYSSSFCQWYSAKATRCS